MIELIYGSHIAAHLELPEIFTILKQAQEHNAGQGLSGVLLFNTRYFLQVLEGPQEAVDALYARIQKDKRHFGIKLISRQPIQRQQWQQWSMALVTPGVNNHHVLQKYCKTQDFTPLTLTPDQARGLLKELTESAPQA